MNLGLTQPLTEMSTRNISCGVKAAGAQGWQTYHLRVQIVLKSGGLSLLENSGPVQACNGIALPLHHTHRLSRTPLGEWSARRRGRYLHHKHKRRTSMPSAGFEHAIPLIERLQTYVLDLTATGIDHLYFTSLLRLCICELSFAFIRLHLRTNKQSRLRLM